MTITLPPLDHKIKVFIADDSLIAQEPGLTNYPYPAYRQKYLQAGADFFWISQLSLTKSRT